MKWNGRSLLHACETLLRQPDCTLSLRTIDSENEVAHCTFKWRKEKPVQVKIAVDPAQSGLIQGVLHELLHVKLLGDLKGFTDPLEEVAVVALEKHLWTKVMRRGDVARWRRIINSKLR